jgi:hypothetical protein
VQIEFKMRKDWPALAWVALCGREVSVEHGPRVAVGSGWAFEGAWAGAFGGGDFDGAAVVCGSGVVARGSAVVFVSPTSTIDRLCSLERSDGTVIVSNSILALTAAGGVDVIDPKYPAKVKSIVRGLDRCAVSLATSEGFVRLTHFNNLTWDGERLIPRAKPRPAEGFGDFAAYRDFLQNSFAELAANAADPSRQQGLRLLGTLSSGYDANAATALAAEAGCREAICFETTGSGQPDSGVPVAEALRVKPIVVERDSWRTQPQLPGGTEAPFLAAGAGSGLIGFHAAQEHLTDALLVSGFYGDSIWNPEWSKLGPDIVRKDASGLGFCEYRLHAGFANCAPAFWAAREVADVVAISRSQEMEAWTLGRGYDRPVPRRMAEEAGAPRDVFGNAKRAVPKAQPHRDPDFLMPEPKRAYFAWLGSNRERLGLRSPVSPIRDSVEFHARDVALRSHVALRAVPGLGSSGWWESRRDRLRRRRRRPTPLRSHATEWALDRGKRAYADAERS